MTTLNEMLAADTEKEVARLARVDRGQYDRERQKIAEFLDVRVVTLDKMVAEARAELTKKAPALRVEPCAEAVDGAALFTAIEAIIGKHLVLPKGAATAMAAWVGHSWTCEAANHTPLLALLSPEPECGKSTTIKVMTRLCRNPKPASNISPAAIYYAIEEYNPMTLFMDEMDSQPDGGEACRNILNSGHERELAYVTRTEEVGGKRQLVEFNTFCPKVVASIGKLKPTLMSRSIIVWLRRKRPDETVVSLGEDEGQFGALQSRLARWAEDNLDALKSTKPTLPATLSNRAADNWRELFRIAEVLGGGWTEKFTTAASALIGARKLDTATVGSMLLADVRTIFELERSDVLKSETIIGHLVTMEERPWPDWKSSKPMTAQQMAKVLEPFDISPRQHWHDGKNVRGYSLAQFDDVFRTYLPQAARPARPLEPAEIRHSENAKNRISSGLAPLAGVQNHGRPNEEPWFEAGVDGEPKWES